MDRWSEDWQEWRCSDCDPELADDDQPDDPAREHTRPYVLLVPVGEPKPDLCPRCGGYLSLIDGDKKLRVTNTPAERWAAKRRERSAWE